MNAVYIRTSTQEQNPENQLAEIEIISGKEYQLFRDQQSAWKEDKERQDFDKLLSLIKSSKVQELYIWDLDRLYRNRLRVVEFFKLCKAYKCNIHSYRQAWLEEIYKIPSPWNEIVSEMIIQIMGWMAQEESEKKSKRVKLAVRKKGETTISYKGNKWGRKALSTQKKNLISVCLERVPKPSIRAIAKELSISVGVVHKYTQEITPKENSINETS